MCLTDKTIDFLNRLKSYDGLGEVNIIRAYPFVNKPTRLQKVAITVSAANADGENVSLGDSILYTEYVIDADIFIPKEMGSSDMENYIEAVLYAQAESFPLKIAVSRVKYDKYTDCYTAKCSFSYKAAIELGGI